MVTRPRAILVTSLSGAALVIAALAFALGGAFNTVGAAPAASSPVTRAAVPHFQLIRGSKGGGAKGSGSNLIYHGGPVEQSTSTNYAIFWEPPTLQSGAPAVVSATYNGLVERYFQDVGGHGLYNNNTQYFQTVGGVNQFIVNSSSLGGFVVDTSAYPASGCKDRATPGSCLTDAQIQVEVQRVMTAQGWQAASTHEFFVYTAKGEGSCLGSKCSFTFFCAYHSNFTNGAGQTVLYANQPYDDTSPAGCDVSTSPNNDLAADSVINSTSHEHMETVTDELGSAWFDSRGAEIGDKCNFNFGAVTLDGGLANQDWNNHFYIVQQEWDNAANGGAGGCVQTGP